MWRSLSSSKAASSSSRRSQTACSPTPSKCRTSRLNDDGRPQRGTRAALNLAIRPDTYQRLKALGVRLNSRTPLAPGRYQLRVGARDPLTGKAGTVFTDLTVPEFTRRPLMMSGVLVSSAEAAGRYSRRSAMRSAEKLLGAPATSRRDVQPGRDAGMDGGDLRQLDRHSSRGASMWRPG